MVKVTNRPEIGFGERISLCYKGGTIGVSPETVSSKTGTLLFTEDKNL